MIRVSRTLVKKPLISTFHTDENKVQIKRNATMKT